MSQENVEIVMRAFVASSPPSSTSSQVFGIPTAGSPVPRTGPRRARLKAETLFAGSSDASQRIGGSTASPMWRWSQIRATGSS